MHLASCLWIHSSYQNYYKNIIKFSLITVYLAVYFYYGFENLSFFWFFFSMFLWLWAWNLVLEKEFNGKTYLIEKIKQQYGALTHRSFRYFHITFPPFHSTEPHFSSFTHPGKLSISARVFFISVCLLYKFALSLVLSCSFLNFLFL